MKASDVTLCYCVEPGILEPQTLTSIQTLRRYGGALAQAPVLALSPRGRELSARTAAGLEELDVELAVENVLPSEIEHGVHVKPYALKWMAERAAMPWFFDSDTFVASDLQPLLDLLDAGHDFVLGPATDLSIGSPGPGHRNDPLWTAAYDLIGTPHRPFLPFPFPYHQIRAYWNSGLIIGRRPEFFAEFLNVYEVLSQSDHPMAKRYLAEQFSFALAMTKSGYRFVQDPGTNVDAQRLRTVAPEDVRVVHYVDCSRITYVDDTAKKFYYSGLYDLPHGRAIMELWEKNHLDFGKPKCRATRVNLEVPVERTKKPFMIYTYPSSGGYQLRKQLNQLSDVYCHGEVFKNGKVALPDWHAHILGFKEKTDQEAVAARDELPYDTAMQLSSLNPHKHVGFMGHSSQPPIHWILIFSNLTVLILIRDPIELYLTLQQGRQARENPSSADEGCVFTPESWERFANSYSYFLHQAQVARGSHPHTSQEVNFSDLHSAEQIHQLGAFIGSSDQEVNPGIKVEGQLEGNLRDAFANYDELEAYLANHPHELFERQKQLVEFSAERC